jgi:hypothetical protein
MAPQHLSKSERVLKPAERALLAYLERYRGDSYLELARSGKIHFCGCVLGAPRRINAATFLAFLADDLIEAEVGFGVRLDVKAQIDGDLPEEAPPGNVVRLRRLKINLAKWFFTLSQALSADRLAVEPHGFALVLVGEKRVEVLCANLTIEEKCQAAGAILRRLAPGAPALLVPRYAISDRGVAILRIAELEDRIDADPGYPSELFAQRDELFSQLPERCGKAKAESGAAG